MPLDNWLADGCKHVCENLCEIKCSRTRCKILRSLVQNRVQNTVKKHVKMSKISATKKGRAVQKRAQSGGGGAVARAVSKGCLCEDHFFKNTILYI